MRPLPGLEQTQAGVGEGGNHETIARASTRNLDPLARVGGRGLASVVAQAAVVDPQEISRLRPITHLQN